MRFSSRLLSIFIVLTKMLCLLFLAVNSIAYSHADAYRQIELRHRPAASLQQSLAPLMSDKVAIVVEANSLILRGPVDQLNQLSAIIKKLDKPQQQIAVSIFRGIDPSKQGMQEDRFEDKKWSTNNGKQNRLDQVVINEGETLIITEKEWFLVPLESSFVVDRSRGGGNDESYSDISNAQVNQPEKNSHLLGISKRNQLMSIEKNVELSAVIIKAKSGENVLSLSTSYALPTQQRKNGQLSPTAESHKTLTQSRLVSFDKWQLLSSQSQHSEPVDYSSNRKSSSQVFSTNKNGEYEYKVWARFSLFEEK